MLAQDGPCHPGTRRPVVRIEVVTPSEDHIHHFAHRAPNFDYSIMKRVGTRWQCEGFDMNLHFGS
jgi:hypothetical protein